MPGVTEHGSSLWEFPRHFVEMLFEHRRVAVTSSRSTAKTYTCGQIGAAFFLTRPSRVMVVAPTLRQATKGVMSELRAAIGRMPDPPAFAANNAAELRFDDRHWVMCLPSRDPDSMRGFHASPSIPSDPDSDEMTSIDVAAIQEAGDDTSTPLLLIIDEAASVQADAYRVLRGMMTKPHVYVVLTGNPTLGADEDHDYVRAFREGSRYHRIRVSSVPEHEVPTPDGIEYDEVFDRVPAYLVAPDEIDSARREMSADDPIFIADWAGTFASGSNGWNVVPRTALLAALATNYANLRPLGPRIGVDIGTGSPDMCVASLFVDGVKRCEHVFAPDRDDLEGQVTIASTIMALAAKWGEEIEGRAPGGSSWDGSPIPGSRISIDDSGLVGVGDILSSRGYHVDRVNFARKASGMHRDLVGTQRFSNMRTEMHWVARRGLQEGVFVIPAEFTRSWEEATWTQYERAYDAKGPVIKLEPKERVIKRHKRSPDTFDADILAMRAPRLESIVRQEGGLVVSPHSGQPIVNGRLRPTRLKGGRRIG